MAKTGNVKNKVYGIHAVEALLTHSPEKVQLVYMQKNRHDEKFHRILLLAKKHQISLQYLNDFPPHAQGVLAICTEKKSTHTLEALLASLTEPPLLLILDGVQDPHNLGACIRSANASGCHAVIIPKDRAAPLNETAKKAASGAAEFMPVITVTNLSQTLKYLKAQGIWIYGMAGSASKTLYSENFKLATAFVMGGEGEGLRRLTSENCDVLLSIPMKGEIESLNVSVAAGVCLFEALRQRREFL
jgi:23S rRNA (guanosine2251-2'-O)-methyltransferase